jgi:hypothetical protein
MSIIGAHKVCLVRFCASKWCLVVYIILYARWYLFFNFMKNKGNIKLACNLQSYRHVVLNDSTASKTKRRNIPRGFTHEDETKFNC